jgi:hypothetical protein
MHSTTTTISKPPRRRIGRILVAAALVACALPASASAARLGRDRLL